MCSPGITGGSSVRAATRASVSLGSLSTCPHLPSMPPVTLRLIGANVAIFFLQMLAPAIVTPFALWPFGSGAAGYGVGFEPWQLLVAVEDDGQVVGACYFSPLDDAGWIDQIAVRGDRRGLGLGRALLVAAFTEARARGATKSVLSTDSRTGALSLYEHVGMRIKQSFVHWAKQLGTDSAVASGT